MISYSPLMNRRTILLAATGLIMSACGNEPIGLSPSDAQTNAQTDGDWLPSAAPALPFAVQEIYPCLHAGRIHLAGGLTPSGLPSLSAATHHVSWAPGEAEWRPETPLPIGRHHPQLVSFGGKLLAIGGFVHASQQARWVMRSDTLVWDSGVWQPGPSLPQPIGESVCAVLDSRLHICGGRVPSGSANRAWTDHIDTKGHFILSAGGEVWNTAAPLPTPRNSAAAAVIGPDWHVVGGRTVRGGNTDRHEVYDPREDRWRIAAPMPQAQGGLAAAAIGDNLFAFGGEYFGSGAGVFAESWAYTKAQDSWAAIPDMPTPRHGLGAVAINDKIYVIGGARQASGRDTSGLVEVFSVAT